MEHGTYSMYTNGACRCDPCRAAGSAYYTEHKEAAAVRSKQQHAAFRVFLAPYKSGPCEDCGGLYPAYVYDFDHRNPATKSFGLSTGGSHPRADVLAEIAKCDLVCANCHRERTFGERKCNPVDTAKQLQLL